MSRDLNSVHPSNELRDLVVSWIVLSLCFAIPYIRHLHFHGVLASFLAVGTGFATHELAHRTVARRMGLLARYQAWWGGLLLAFMVAIISTIAFRSTIVFAAPGAVVVYTPWSGIYAVHATYLVSLAGPLTNVGIAFVSWVVSRLAPPIISYYAYITAYVNAVLALFNSLPIPPLDGYKVIRYSVVHWLLLFILSLTLFIVVR
ncbi:MAG: site-2 protease family protein [Thermoprotei archaeon]|nr:MAG: site-2 protease family protein [Thermoprotei archaeon]